MSTLLRTPFSSPGIRVYASPRPAMCIPEAGSHMSHRAAQGRETWDEWCCDDAGEEEEEEEEEPEEQKQEEGLRRRSVCDQMECAKDQRLGTKTVWI
eukprot:169868-Hanusia_phi.AAC.5